MMTIGVDPGLTGAMSLIGRGRVLACVDMPVEPNGTSSGSMKTWIDVAALDAILAEWSMRFSFATEFVHGFMERPVPMPSLPAQTIACQFDTFGVIRALLARRLLGRCQMVNPQEWKKSFGLGKDKAESRKCCVRLYPDAPVTLVKHHNRAESVLIAHWGFRSIA